MNTPTPDELAEELGVSGKTVRAWLRETYPRPDREVHQRWSLTDAQVEAVRVRFGTPWHRAESREGMVTTTVALPARDHRRLTKAAERLRSALAELIRQAVAEWLARDEQRGKGKQ